MHGGPKKTPSSCPHCGHVQLEPKGLISTYCRGCGMHYSVAEKSPLPKASTHPHSLFRKLIPRYKRRVVCLECGHEHTETAEIKATQCPACGAGINLRDIEVTRSSSREINTQGTVHVGRHGYLNSTRIVCGSMLCEGRVAGKITCSGTVRLRGHGICRAQIFAKNLIVDRGAQLQIPYTIHVRDALIRGVVEAEIVCSGVLRVGRNGGLDGDVQARGMAVDKGAYFLGSVEVSAKSSQPITSKEDSVQLRPVPFWNRGFAFGLG